MRNQPKVVIAFRKACKAQGTGLSHYMRYALRLIADERQDAFLWDGWDQDTETVLNIATL